MREFKNKISFGPPTSMTSSMYYDNIRFLENNCQKTNNSSEQAMTTDKDGVGERIPKHICFWSIDNTKILVRSFAVMMS